jgi:UDP-N-acetylglucosamine acyltransferase
MSNIHPTAIIGDEVTLAEDVQIGPNCVLLGKVSLGSGVRLMASVHLQGPLTVGDRSVFYPGALIGFEPQDYKFKPGMPTAGVEIGADCIFREHSTVHAASNDQKPTHIGDRTFFMVNTHAGHDAWVGSDVVMVNNTGLGGHSEVHDRAILSGGTMVHQFGRIGRQAMTSGVTTLTNDLPPYFMASERNTVVGVNIVGMRRAGMPRDEITAVKRAYTEVFRRNLPTREMHRELKARGQDSQAVNDIYEFVITSKRAICPVGGRKRSRAIDDQGQVVTEA